jgi:hypothetical protein
VEFSQRLASTTCICALNRAAGTSGDVYENCVRFCAVLRFRVCSGAPPKASPAATSISPREAAKKSPDWSQGGAASTPKRTWPGREAPRAFSLSVRWSLWTT